MRRALAVALLALALVPSSALGATGKVQGRITPTAWAPEVEVCLFEETRASELCATPAADGSYALEGLPLSLVKVEFIPSYRSRLAPQWYNHENSANAADLILLTENTPTRTGINADLVEAGVIEGVVTAAGGGQPLAGVEACAVSTGSSGVKSCSETNADGEYELHSLPTGSYKVGFFGQGPSAAYMAQYYQGRQSQGEATVVSTTNGLVTPGINAQLVEGGRIAGAVTAATNGAPLEGITVCLFTATASKAEKCTYSGISGTYAFQGLASRSYQVGFSLGSAEIGNEAAGGEEDGFQAQYYSAASARSEAKSISVIAPASVNGIDAALQPPAEPPPPPLPPVVVTPLTAPPPPVAEPKPKQKGCKKGYRKQKVKGKTRCVKVHKKKPRAKKKSSKSKQHGGKRGGAK